MSNITNNEIINNSRVKKCIIELYQNENQYNNSINIDENGVLTYLYNCPNDYFLIEEADIHFKRYNNEILYIIPHFGDVLLDIKISGILTSATLFQYDSSGSTKIIYESIDNFQVPISFFLKTSSITNEYYEVSESKEYILDPFPNSGIPLLQLPTNLYLSIQSTDKSSIEVLAKQAFIDTKERQLLSMYSLDNIHGIKIKHKNNDIYQIVNINDSGFSPNKLIKL